MTTPAGAARAQARREAIRIIPSGNTVAGTGPKIKTPAGEAPIIPLLLIFIGGYLAWYGVHYFKKTRPDGSMLWPSDPVKGVLTGKPVTVTAEKLSASDTATLTAAFTSSGTGAGGGGTPVVTGSGSAIANDALKYAGQGYVWGGNADHPGNWDCSSFVSYVLGHDLGLPLPGGHWGSPGFPPGSHGPTTVQYLLYGSPIGRSQVQAGDLIVWQTHIGIAIDGTRMISAQDEQLGTGIGAFDNAIPGETASYRRVATGGGGGGTVLA